MAVEKEERIFKGIAASPGVAHASAFVYLQKELEIPSYLLPEDRVNAEVARFEHALLETRQQIAGIQREIAEKLGESEALIFDAHLLVLEDTALIGETARGIREQRMNAEKALHGVVDQFIQTFAAMEDAYLRERVADLRDVSRRLLRNLMGRDGVNLADLASERIIVAEDLSPSDAAGLDHAQVQAIITDVGSRTSHAVIMARSLNVPAVVGTHFLTQHVQSGDTLIVDGYDGLVILNPSEQSLFRYGKIERARRNLRRRYEVDKEQPACTRDGARVAVNLNIEGFEEVEMLIGSGGDGVGLFRTESVFMRSERFPGEEEQYEAYRRVVEGLSPRPVVIRTLDLGGDKLIADTPDYASEENPFMGFRAIRYCLEHPLLFKKQLRAILRASAHGRVRLMYPMVSGVEEVVRANQLLQECREELRRRDLPFDEQMQVGSMIEIPAAALAADLIAPHADFFSIGTNDLIQYMLAVDRVNDQVAHLYEPRHPAILRIMQNVVAAAERAGIPVSVCGEVAGDPLYVPLLIGMGVRDLSVTGSVVPEVKYLIRQFDLGATEALAGEALAASGASQIDALLTGFRQRYAPAPTPEENGDEDEPEA